jgi:hypothetical protein
MGAVRDTETRSVGSLAVSLLMLTKMVFDVSPGRKVIRFLESSGESV